jgi:hypothetical protein
MRTLKKGRIAVRGVYRGVGNLIDKNSFVHEYTDQIYSQLNTEDFQKYYRLKNEDLWEGFATLEGTRYASLKNPRCN